MQTISRKEMFSLENLLEKEKLLVQKFGTYASEAQDPQIADVCRRAQQAHTYHYELLLKQLEVNQYAF